MNLFNLCLCVMLNKIVRKKGYKVGCYYRIFLLYVEFEGGECLRIFVFFILFRGKWLVEDIRW